MPILPCDVLMCQDEFVKCFCTNMSVHCVIVPKLFIVRRVIKQVECGTSYFIKIFVRHINVPIRVCDVLLCQSPKQVSDVLLRHVTRDAAAHFHNH